MTLLGHDEFKRAQSNLKLRKSLGLTGNEWE